MSNVDSNILNVLRQCKENGHAQHDFEPLEECHWIFSGYKVNVMFILSESCCSGLWINKNIFMVCLQTAELKRETGRLLHGEGLSYRWRPRLSDASRMHTTCAFTFIAVSKWHLFRIPASKRICMNVGVFRNKARRKKILVSCTPEQTKQLAKVRMQSGNA